MPKQKTESSVKMKARQAARLSAEQQSAEPKRPSPNGDMPDEAVQIVRQSLGNAITQLEKYAAHLRSLDRLRLKSVGIKRMGFATRAYEYAMSSPEFLPNYLSKEQFQNNDRAFANFRALCDISETVHELLWNLTIQSADTFFNNALWYYGSVREAAIRGIDPAETIRKDLHVFFRRAKGAGGQPTEKQLKRDVKALLHGKKDGKIVIENVSPKTTGGRHKVIDEKYSDTAQFSETEESEN